MGVGINAQKFARAFVLPKAQREFMPLIETLGPKVWKILLDKNRDLSDYLLPEIQNEIRAGTKGNAWVNNILTDQDFFDMLPAWAKPLITEHGEQGKAWYKRQSDWFRTFLS